jgi:hypothetical protein
MFNRQAGGLDFGRARLGSRESNFWHPAAAEHVGSASPASVRLHVGLSVTVVPVVVAKPNLEHPATELNFYVFYLF